MSKKFGAEPNVSLPGAVSPIGEGFKRLKFPRNKVTWPDLKCISIRRTRILSIWKGSICAPKISTCDSRMLRDS